MYVSYYIDASLADQILPGCDAISQRLPSWYLGQLCIWRQSMQILKEERRKRLYKMQQASLSIDAEFLIRMFMVPCRLLWD